MSYVEKIMSDVIQTTSDLFSAVANLWETVYYNKLLLCGYLPVTLCVTSFCDACGFFGYAMLFGTFAI